MDEREKYVVLKKEMKFDVLPEFAHALDIQTVFHVSPTLISV